MHGSCHHIQDILRLSIIQVMAGVVRQLRKLLVPLGQFGLAPGRPVRNLLGQAPALVGLASSDKPRGLLKGPEYEVPLRLPLATKAAPAVMADGLQIRDSRK